MKCEYCGENFTPDPNAETPRYCSKTHRLAAGKQRQRKRQTSDAVMHEIMAKKVRYQFAKLLEISEGLADGYGRDPQYVKEVMVEEMQKRIDAFL